MFWNQNEDNIWIVGHRGAKALFPENTMESFEGAINIGVDGIETDVHMTTDGKLVLFHDNELERTTNGIGRVEDYSYEDLKKLDAGSHFSEKYAGARIPLFEELLDLVKGPNFMLNIEMKDYRCETVDKTIKMLEDYGFTDRYVIACFNSDVTEYAHKKHGVKTQGFPKNMVINYNEVSFSHYYSIGIPINLLTKELCDEYNCLGIDPWCWCPDTLEAVQNILGTGITLLTANNPLPALKILR